MHDHGRCGYRRRTPLESTQRSLEAPVPSAPTTNMELLSSVTNYISEFRYEPGVTPLTSYWTPLTIGASYLVGVYLLQMFMKNRERIPAKTFSLIHNFNMYAISIICFLGIGYGVAQTLYLNGWAKGVEYLFCDSRREYINKGPLFFWMYIFYLSKFYELIDTVLIVLRKSKLLFLHVYHHWVTMLLCIVCLNSANPYQWTATGLNALVHIPMYYYYMCAILKIDLWWKKYMTQFQIVQFCLDISACLVSAYMNSNLQATTCSSWEKMWPNAVALAIVMSYLLLFIQFYFQTYRRAAPKTDSSAPAKTEPKKDQ